MRSFIAQRDGRKYAELIRYTDMDYVKDADSHGDIVHHKSYINLNNIFDPAVTINFENLELLCIDCHNKEHISTFDESGMIKPKQEDMLELAGVYKK